MQNLSFICVIFLITMVYSSNKANLKSKVRQAPATTTATPAPANNSNIVTPGDPALPDYTAARNINCSNTNCLLPNNCSTDKKTCLCSNENSEYTLNYPLKSGEKRQDVNSIKLFCEHTRKNQLTYFLLEFFLNIGAGHFYAGNTGMGVGKLLLIFVPCLAVCIFAALGLLSTDKLSGGLVSCFLISASCAMSIWWLVDVIMIATSKYTDGMGVPLKHW